MIPRLERILYKLAQQHAPSLTPPGWEQRGDPISRIQTLARNLADYDVIVLLGEVDQEIMAARDVHIQDWIRSYGQLYGVLATTLFPSHSRISAYYADDRMPPVVVFEGNATPVMMVFSGYLNPYLALRQPAVKQVTELELRGMVELLLSELEATDLPRAIYDDVRDQAVGFIWQMLNSTIRHVSLTPFDKPIFQPARVAASNGGTGGSRPVRATPPPPPPGVPGQRHNGRREIDVQPPDELPQDLTLIEGDDQPTTPTEEMFVNGIPLGNGNGKGSTRRPPIPDLPRRRNK